MQDFAIEDDDRTLVYTPPKALAPGQNAMIVYDSATEGAAASLVFVRLTFALVKM